MTKANKSARQEPNKDSASWNPLWSEPR